MDGTYGAYRTYVMRGAWGQAALCGLRGTRWIAFAMLLALSLASCREHRSEVGPDGNAAAADAAPEAAAPAPAPAAADDEQAAEPAPADGSDGGISHEWTRVYRVEERGGTRSTLPVGFLHRRFSEDDPEGRVYVVDRLHVERGYLLPDGRTLQFQFDGDTVVGLDDLGNTGFDTGVKRLLGVAGGIEYERVELSANDG